MLCVLIKLFLCDILIIFFTNNVFLLYFFKLCLLVKPFFPNFEKPLPIPFTWYLSRCQRHHLLVSTTPGTMLLVLSWHQRFQLVTKEVNLNDWHLCHEKKLCIKLFKPERKIILGGNRHNVWVEYNNVH